MTDMLMNFARFKHLEVHYAIVLQETKKRLSIARNARYFLMISFTNLALWLFGKKIISERYFTGKKTFLLFTGSVRVAVVLTQLKCKLREASHSCGLVECWQTGALICGTNDWWTSVKWGDVGSVYPEQMEKSPLWSEMKINWIWEQQKLRNAPFKNLDTLKSRMWICRCQTNKCLVVLSTMENKCQRPDQTRPMDRVWENTDLDEKIKMTDFTVQNCLASSA